MRNSGAGAKSILVVEDEPAISEVCLRVLTREGLEVDIAANGVIAQDMLWEKHYDLCLIDIRTPLMNGRELYQHINERHEELVKGVILTKGDVISGDPQGFSKQTNRPFLLKPFTPDELKAAIRETVEQIENDWKTNPQDTNR
jgi:DNA-binding response OmpR family regulator